jgi:UDP-glucose 4-epimerase
MDIINTFENINNTKLNYQYVNRRSGDIDIVYSNINKAKNILKWKTKYELEDMLKL